MFSFKDKEVTAPMPGFVPLKQNSLAGFDNWDGLVNIIWYFPEIVLGLKRVFP